MPDISMFADSAAVFRTNQSGQRVLPSGRGTDESEESREFIAVLKQRCEDGLHPVRQSVPAGYLVHEQVACLLAVVDGIVHLVDEQFVVFQQTMVGPLGEKQGRQKERVDEQTPFSPVAEQIPGVVVDDVVAAYEVGILHEFHQTMLVG